MIKLMCDKCNVEMVDTASGDYYHSKVICPECKDEFYIEIIEDEKEVSRGCACKFPYDSILSRLASQYSKNEFISDKVFPKEKDNCLKSGKGYFLVKGGRK